MARREQDLIREITDIEHQIFDLIEEARRDPIRKAELRSAGVLLQVRLDFKRRELRMLASPHRQFGAPIEQIDRVARVTGNVLLGAVLVLVIVALGLQSCGALVP